MFKPKYTITNQLLANVKRINLLIAQLNNRRFPKVILFNLAKTAREVSTHASTSIEGNPLPLTEVKRILKNKPAHARESEKEVINYNQALEYLSQKKGDIDLSLSLVLSIHKLTMDGLMENKKDIGHLRTRPIVVNDPRSRQVAYLPPDEKEVKPLMTQLVNFINKNKGIVDPLILSGIFHKQMVLIHPFMDGNGRTTRLSTKVLLSKMGLDTFNLFSFENYYNKNVTKYFQNVGEYGDYYELQDKIDFTLWLEYFTDGIIDELLRVESILPKDNINPKNEIEEYHKKILDFIKNKGYIKDSDYSKLTNRARPTRALDFKKLINLGLIKRNGKGKATYYTLDSNH